MQHPNNEQIVYVAAHSGGHIIPAITLAKNNQLKDKILITSNQNLDIKIIQQNAPSFECLLLDLPHTPRQKSFIVYASWVYKCFKSFILSLKYLFNFKNCKVVSTGGVLSIPVCLAAKLLNKNIELYELNVKPGKSSRILASLADKIFVIYQETAKLLKHKNIEITSYPIKWSNYQEPTKQEINNFKNNFGDKKYVILIVGGSQGAKGLNNLVTNWFDKCQLDECTIIHQTGPENHAQKFYTTNQINGYTYEFIENLKPFYQMADLVICRAGAGAIAEGLWSKAQIVLVPLQGAAENHQLENARAAAMENPSRIMLIAESNQDLLDDCLLKQLLKSKALRSDQHAHLERATQPPLDN
jgi:UDP-N-acetylglucosamine--N-acetylmuramyl-(pentapeptide) pyrophosphoryl-undecaprenol N-acetylglucosamine transferase